MSCKNLVLLACLRSAWFEMCLFFPIVIDRESLPRKAAKILPVYELMANSCRYFLLSYSRPGQIVSMTDVLSRCCSFWTFRYVLLINETRLSQARRDPWCHRLNSQYEHRRTEEAHYYLIEFERD